MTVYTRQGDRGETGLLFGGRVSKSDARCEAYGSTDEAVSAMGLARALSTDSRVVEILLKVQREMFTVGAELATDRTYHAKLRQSHSVVTAEMVNRLEQTIDELDSQMAVPRAFIVPGGSPGSAALDLARSLVRTSERRVVSLQDSDELPNTNVLSYLNRLSDLLFVLARFEDRELPDELVSEASP